MSKRRRKKRKIRKVKSIEHLSPIRPDQVARYDGDMKRTRLEHWWQWLQEIKYGQF